MKRFIKYALIAIAGIILLCGAAIGFLYWALMHDFIEETTGPITREEAARHCPIPLPASAHDIQYASFSSGMQCSERFVRFEAPVSDCHSFAQSLFAMHAKDHRGYIIPEFRATNHPESVESEHHLRTDWFDTDRDSKWVVAGRGHSWQPKIWIDEERGIFYFYVTD